MCRPSPVLWLHRKRYETQARCGLASQLHINAWKNCEDFCLFIRSSRLFYIKNFFSQERPEFGRFIFLWIVVILRRNLFFWGVLWKNQFWKWKIKGKLALKVTTSWPVVLTALPLKYKRKDKFTNASVPDLPAQVSGWDAILKIWNIVPERRFSLEWRTAIGTDGGLGRLDLTGTLHFEKSNGGFSFALEANAPAGTRASWFQMTQ